MAFFKGKKSTGRSGSPKKIGSDRGGRSFGGDRAGTRREGRPTMHSAKCSGCGNSCEVPFRPSGEKPVYCHNCFKGKDGDSRDSRSSRDIGKKDSYSGGRDSKPRYNDKSTYQHSGGEVTSNYKPQFDQINHKLDEILNILSARNIDDQKLWGTDKEEISESVVEEVKKPVLKKGALKKAILKKAVKKKKAAKKVASKKKK
ncbi:hypothetical protein HQ403_00540 [Candidatus Kaiserbacteria bacterium]|nr:hypothetical protein [Candidatus Kaiserbacteria bacterium]